MLPITSGTSTERIVRTLLLSLMVDIFAVYFLYDGYVGYPRANARQLVKLLGVPASEPPASNQTLSAERGRKLIAATRPGDPLDKLTNELGAATIRQGTSAYFLGPGGWLQVDLDGERVRTMKWFDGPHTEADMSIQRLLGWILVVLGFAATINLVRVLSARAELAEKGLRVSGARLIPFEAITGLQQSPTQRGVSELQYSIDGRAETLRLDPYLYKEARAIARAIAEQKGFPAPSGTP